MQEYYRISSEVLPSIHYVDETLIRPPFVHKARRAGEYIIYVVKHGEMYLEEDGVELYLTAGDICMLDKDRTHRGIRSSECDYYYIHFMHPMVEMMQFEDEKKAMQVMLCHRKEALKSNHYSYDPCTGNYLYIPKIWKMPNDNNWLNVLELLHQAIQYNNNPLENYKILCACRIQEVLIEIFRCFLSCENKKNTNKMPASYARVQELLEWLNHNYKLDITSEMMEKELGSNYDYINRIFKRITGKTIFQYLTIIRINQAKILISQTTMKMSEVGTKVGFADEYYFNRLFKKYVGVPPATYAKEISVHPFIQEE